MARTKRKPGVYVKYTDVSYTTQAFGYYQRYPYTLVRVRKTQEEYDQDLRAEQQRYQEELATSINGKWKMVPSIFEPGYRLVPIRPPYVRKYRYIRTPQSPDEFVQEKHREREEFTRDGVCSESSRKKGFRKEAAKNLRRKNKRVCDQILHGEDWDDVILPTRRDEKKLIWSWW